MADEAQSRSASPPPPRVPPRTPPEDVPPVMDLTHRETRKRRVVKIQVPKVNPYVTFVLITFFELNAWLLKIFQQPRAIKDEVISTIRGYIKLECGVQVKCLKTWVENHKTCVDRNQMPQVVQDNEGQLLDMWNHFEDLIRSKKNFAIPTDLKIEYPPTHSKLGYINTFMTEERALELRRKTDKEAVAERERKTVQDIVSLFVNTTVEKNVKGVENEFSKDCGPMFNPDTMRAYNKNMKLHAYQSVGCFDHNRVVLRDFPKTDYIHASYVSTAKHKQRLICCQLATKEDRNRFFHMIFQERVTNTVVLMNDMEVKSMKELYFPRATGRRCHLEGMTVTCDGWSNLKLNGNATIKEYRMKLEKNNVVHYFKIYLWISWPVGGIPKQDQSAIDFLKKLQEAESPIAIQSMKGTGRVGVPIYILFVLDSMEKRLILENGGTIFKKLRLQRNGLVETRKQYMITYAVLLDYFVLNGWIPETMTGKVQNFVNEARKRGC